MAAGAAPPQPPPLPPPPKKLQVEKPSKSTDILSILTDLCKEKLLVSKEKESIQQLNETIKCKSEELNQYIWKTMKQRLHLSAQHEFTQQSSDYIKQVEQAQFIDAKYVLGFQTTARVENLLKTLRSRPDYIAYWLVGSDQQFFDNVLESIVIGLFGCCLYSDDLTGLLKLLVECARLHANRTNEKDENNTLNECNGAFTMLYKQFQRIYIPANCFLNIFDRGIRHVSLNSTLYLDYNPQKSLMRYKQQDFSEFRDLIEYREAIVSQLIDFTLCFAQILHENIGIFPKNIAWLVNRISTEFNTPTVIASQLLLQHYICFGIVNRMKHLQLSEMTEHNLNEIMNLIQVLSLEANRSDSTLEDIYIKMGKNVNDIQNWLQEVLSVQKPTYCDEEEEICRTSILFLESELIQLITFLQKKPECIDVPNVDLIEEQLTSLDLLCSEMECCSKSSSTSKPNFLSMILKSSTTNTISDKLTVFVLQLGTNEKYNLLSESKLLSMRNIKKNVGTVGGKEAKYLYTDDGSIPSDNLEAVSVASSLELEAMDGPLGDQNDNLSDMISANVSGRGSPNISGRTTPSSSVVNAEVTDRPRQQQANRQIDDKFCKFEIKKLFQVDETISIISETWSTDVLASDNETIDVTDATQPTINLLSDISETHSESAWSTDVIGSDTERLIEIEPETNNKAQSHQQQQQEQQEQEQQQQQQQQQQQLLLLQESNGPTTKTKEILLSNCSLNSSSSGGSSSTSSNSFENTSKSQLELVNDNKVISNGSNKNRTIKSAISTGAIPKSISFDVSVDKGLEDDGRKVNKGSFFGKLKMGFSRNRRGNRHEHHNNNSIVDLSTTRSSFFNDCEVSDDILAKYRQKLPSFCDDFEKSSSTKSSTIYESNNFDTTNSFDDIKRKLRLVLSDIDLSAAFIYERSALSSFKQVLETILRSELGKTRRLGKWTNTARIWEALRCVSTLNENTCQLLVLALRKDQLNRSVYVQYLITSKQDMLLYDYHLTNLQEIISYEHNQNEDYISAICTRTFLAQHQSRLQSFEKEFSQITPVDEKFDHLYHFQNDLDNLLRQQILFAPYRNSIRLSIERFVMSKVYLFALYPNGDGDRHRDTVFLQHVDKLAGLITPNHKDLMIDKVFLKEFPWTPAQEILKTLDTYRTPQEKITCIVQCAKCIMELLALSQYSTTTTADDYTPVLVYVIIKVNPANILSTIQYVNSFYQNLHGEELYWWTQFSAAVEFIKTMEYCE